MLANNLDGDYMAYGTVQGEYVPVVLDDATNHYLRVSTVSDPMPAYYTWFNYGASNALSRSAVPSICRSARRWSRKA